MTPLTYIVTLIGEIGILIGVVFPVIISVRKIANGQKCSSEVICSASIIITVRKRR